MAPMTDPNALVATSPASLATNPQLSLPQNFPLALSPQQQDSLLARVDAFRFTEISQHDIAALALEPELALNRTLDEHANELLASLSERERTAVENSLLLLLKALREDTAATCCPPAPEGKESRSCP
jgi:hypothetical protein